MKKYFLLLAIVSALSASPLAATAQTNFNINWYKIAGGGGMNSTGGVYTLSGTIGQPDAGPQMTDGYYSLTGGFWAIYAVQTAGAPLLNITRSGSKAVVWWDPSVTGWTLQTNVNLAKPTTWGNYLGPIVNNSTTNSPPPNDLFFRLKQ